MRRCSRQLSSQMAAKILKHERAEKFQKFEKFLTAEGLAQLVEHLTAEREVAGSISGAGPILRVLRITEKWSPNMI